MKKVDLSIFENSWYQPGSRLKIVVWHLFNRLFINTYFLFPQYVKRFILTLFGADLGKNIVIKPKVNIKYPWFLSIGDNSWIGENVWIDNLARVIIGKNVCLSQGALLLTGNHDYTSSHFDLMIGEIILEDGVWIGAKAIVCPGVTCQTHSILSVNSVANKELEAYGIYQGNPATMKKKRNVK